MHQTGPAEPHGTGGETGKTVAGPAAAEETGAGIASSAAHKTIKTRFIAHPIIVTPSMHSVTFCTAEPLIRTAIPGTGSA